MTGLTELGIQLQAWSANMAYYNKLTTTPYYLLNTQEQQHLNELLDF